MTRLDCFVIYYDQKSKTRDKANIFYVHSMYEAAPRMAFDARDKIFTVLIIREVTKPLSKSITSMVLEWKCRSLEQLPRAVTPTAAT